VALSGGSTPKVIYELLATPAWSQKNDWKKIHFFWGDERGVPADHPDSNYRMTKQALLSKIPVPEGNVHRVQTELGAEKAAEAYEKTLREFFPGEPWPPIDLMLLGLGENGHTASLFPHIKMLHEQKKWVAAEYIEEVKMDRISMTAPAINYARKTVFLISGKSKAEVVHDVLRGKHQPEQLPSQLIHPTNGPYLWLLDRDAAAQVSQ
jgi:6-phosphogluconolactonase